MNEKRSECTIRGIDWKRCTWANQALASLFLFIVPTTKLLHVFLRFLSLPIFLAKRSQRKKSLLKSIWPFQRFCLLTLTWFVNNLAERWNIDYSFARNLLRCNKSQTMINGVRFKVISFSIKLLTKTSNTEITNKCDILKCSKPLKSIKTKNKRKSKKIYCFGSGECEWLCVWQATACSKLYTKCVNSDSNDNFTTNYITFW